MINLTVTRVNNNYSFNKGEVIIFASSFKDAFKQLVVAKVFNIETEETIEFIIPMGVASDGVWCPCDASHLVWDRLPSDWTWWDADLFKGSVQVGATWSEI